MRLPTTPKSTTEMDELDPVARIVWKLARNHTWDQPMPEQAVMDIAAKDEDRDEMRVYLSEALDLSFISSGPHGMYIPNGQGAHVAAANWLLRNTALQEYMIAFCPGRGGSETAVIVAVDR